MSELLVIPRYEAYRESGVEWIGKIPSEWELTKLGACLSPVSIKNNPNLPLLSITRELGVIERDIEDQDSNHNFIPDDLSGYKKLEKGQFGMNKMKAWQGSYGVSKYTGIVSPAYYVFNFTKAIQPEFFNWAIRSKLYISYFGSASDGVRVGQWDLSKDRMKAIPFILPSEDEQTAIAQFLDKKTMQIDEAIAIKEKQSKLLKERKQIIIQQAVTQGLNPNVPMKDSGVDWIGQIPESWMAKRIKHVALIQNGQLNPKDKQHKDKILIAPNHIESGTGRILYKETADQQGAESGKYPVKKGALIYSKIRPELRKACIAEEDGMCSADMYSIIPNKLLGSRYMLLVFLGEKFNGLMVNQSMRVAMPKVNRNDVTNYWMAVPPLKEQEEIVQYVSDVSFKIQQALDSQVQQVEKLKEYKVTLINSAVTGKIKVPEVI